MPPLGDFEGRGDGERAEVAEDGGVDVLAVEGFRGEPVGVRVADRQRAAGGFREQHVDAMGDVKGEFGLHACLERGQSGAVAEGFVVGEGSLAHKAGPSDQAAGWATVRSMGSLQRVSGAAAKEVGKRVSKSAPLQMIACSANTGPDGRCDARQTNDYLKKLSILPSDVGRRDGVIFVVARGGASAGVDFVGCVERVANIWGEAVSGRRSLCRCPSLWTSPGWPTGTF